MFLLIFLITLAVVAVSVLLLSVGIILKRGFPNFRISSNANLRKKKIICPIARQKLIDKGIIKNF